MVTGINSVGYVDGPLSKAKFDYISTLTVDDNDNIYVADQLFSVETSYDAPISSAKTVIRKISKNGQVTTVAGDGKLADYYNEVSRFGIGYTVGDESHPGGQPVNGGYRSGYSLKVPVPITINSMRWTKTNKLYIIGGFQSTMVEINLDYSKQNCEGEI